MQRSRPRVALALACALIVSAFAGAPALAANTRVVYFGSAPCPSGSSTCPSPTGWPYPYPYGTGGGYTASGQPIAGQNSFTSATAGNGTATDIVIQNASSSSTLTQIAFNGGSSAPKSINATSVPAMPSPPTPTDPQLCPGGDCSTTPSLPGGLYYQAVGVIANNSNIATNCSLSRTLSTTPQGLYDGVNCAVGNLAPGQSITVRVVVKTPTLGTFEPWFLLGVKEGSSSTGSNSDAFFTYSELSVTASGCGGASNFFANGNDPNNGYSNPSLSNGSACGQAAIVSSNGTFPQGVFESVGTSSANWCLFSTCFGELSTANVNFGAEPCTTQSCAYVTWDITWQGTDLPTSKPSVITHFLDGYDPITNPTKYENISLKMQNQCGSLAQTLCWTKIISTKTSFEVIFRTPNNGSIRLG